MAESGSFSLPFNFGRSATICSVRFTTYTGLPRHSTTIIWPGSSLEISAFTGAPAAFAFAEGCQEPKNGVAIPTAPATPTALVAAVRKRRRPVFTVSSDMIHSTPADYSGGALNTPKPPAQKMKGMVKSLHVRYKPKHRCG